MRFAPMLMALEPRLALSAYDIPPSGVPTDPLDPVYNPPMLKLEPGGKAEKEMLDELDLYMPPANAPRPEHPPTTYGPYDDLRDAYMRGPKDYSPYPPTQPPPPSLMDRLIQLWNDINEDIGRSNELVPNGGPIS